MAKIYKIVKQILLSLSIVIVFTMCNKKKHKEFYENGQLKYQVSLLNGKYNGKAIKYDKNGKLIQLSNWVNGVKEGWSIIYDKNGKVDYKGLFKNGEQVIFEDYDSTGILRRKIELKDNKYNGKYYTYYKNGSIEKEGSFINNKKTGLWKVYFKNKSIKKILLITEGEKILYKKEFNQNGDIISATLPVKVEKVEGLTFRVSLLYTNLPDVAIGVLITSKLKNVKLFEVSDTLVIARSDTTYVNLTLKGGPGDQFYGEIYELNGKNYNVESWGGFEYHVKEEKTFYIGENEFLLFDPPINEKLIIMPIDWIF